MTEIIHPRTIDMITPMELLLELQPIITGYDKNEWQYDLRGIAKTLTGQLGIKIEPGEVVLDTPTPDHAVYIDGYDFWLGGIKGNELFYRIHKDKESTPEAADIDDIYPGPYDVWE